MACQLEIQPAYYSGPYKFDHQTIGLPLTTSHVASSAKHSKTAIIRVGPSLPPDQIGLGWIQEAESAQRTKQSQRHCVSTLP